MPPAPDGPGNQGDPGAPVAGPAVCADDQVAIEPVVGGDVRVHAPIGQASRLAAQVAQRWRSVDPLLPARLESQPGCGVEFAVAGTAGQLAAVGTCEHWTGTSDSLELTWGAAHRYKLTVQVADLDDPGPVDRLLAAWREHLGEIGDAGDVDSSAVVTWPSRDVGGVKALLAHGLAPLAVIAARATPSAQPSGRAERSDVQIRRAGPSDIDEIVRLGLEVIRFDALVSGVTERPSTADALRRELSAFLADAQPWVWLAEDRDDAIGMLAAERPEVARWIGPLVGVSPVAYLLLMGVSPDLRGRGVGAAMAAHLHREVEAAGVAVTLLHYGQVNPLSGPFWSQQGYRPLWTVWEAQPVGNLR
jgi:GNAT superfamily N-acetyltransferase